MPLVRYPALAAQSLEAHLANDRFLGLGRPRGTLEKTSTPQSWNVTWNQQHRSKKGGATSKARKMSFLAGMCLESA